MNMKLLLIIMIVLVNIWIPFIGASGLPGGRIIQEGIPSGSDSLLIHVADDEQSNGVLAEPVSRDGLQDLEIDNNTVKISAPSKFFPGKGYLVHKGSIVNGAGGAKIKAPWGVFVSGNYAYIADTYGAALEIVDISNPAAPVHKGSIIDGAGGASLKSPWGVHVSGNYAYISDCSGNALEIVDISNPAAPVHKGLLKNGTGGAKLFNPRGLFVSGKYAYVTSSSSSALEIVDISNPAAPVHKGFIKDAHATGGAHLSVPTSVYVRGKYAYVADQDNALEIVDISNPASPIHKGSIIHGAGDAILASPMSVQVSGNYAYVAGWVSNSLEIVNISNPAVPLHEGSITDGYGGALLKSPWSVQVSGNYAYLACKDSKSLEIVNISNPKNPTHAASITNGTDGALLNGSVSVWISGNYAYVGSWYSNALEIVDISNPESPTHTGSIRDGASGALLNNPYGVHVSGDYAYVTSDESNSLEIVDISDPSKPRHKGSVGNGVGGAVLKNPRGLFISGSYAFVTSMGSNALEIVNISNSSSPVHAGCVVNGTGGALLNTPVSLFVSGNYAYVASSESNALEIVDISTPSSPVHAGAIRNMQGGALLNSPYGVFVLGNYAYVASWVSNALEIVNISNPAAPTHAGCIVNGTGGALLESPRSVYVSGNYAYIASYGSNALEIVNISDPENPIHAGKIVNGSGGNTLLDHPVSVFVKGNYAYVTGAASDSVEVIDISNPTDPVSFGYVYYNPQFSSALLNDPILLFVSGNYVYVASSASNALEILEAGTWPAITAISPGSSPNTGYQEIIIKGTNFVSGSQARLYNGSVIITGTPVFSNSTTLRSKFSLTGAPTVKYDVVVRNPDDQTAVLPKAFTVSNASPTINGITPISGYNSTDLSVTISGSAFRNGVIVSLTKNGTTLVGSIKNRTLTQILATFNLTGAPSGLYNLTVLNIDSTSAQKNNAFTIQQCGPSPTITNFAPVSGFNTGNLPITINGTNFHAGATITINNWTLIRTATGATITQGQIKCTLPLSGLPFGTYNLTVRNTDGTSVTLTDAFTVKNPVPVISTITPQSGFNGSIVTVTITGSQFASGCTVALVNGSNSIQGTITSYTATKLISNFILSGYPLGLSNVTITNPGGSSCAKVNGFTVLVSGTNPIINNISPEFGVNNATLLCTINGTNFRTGAVVILSSDTTNKKLTPSRCTPEQITCSLPLIRMPIGLYNLTVRNEDGTNYTHIGAFSVVNPNPVISTIKPIYGYNTGLGEITIYGSNFVNGSQITLKNNTVILFGKISSFSPTKLTGIFNLTGASVGLYNISITSPGGSNGTKIGCFSVNSPGFDPNITSYYPVSGLSTAPLQITINGSNFRTGATVIIANEKITKTGSSLAVTKTQIRCSLPLTGMPFGTYNLTVRNTDGSNFTLPAAFTVINPEPKITSIYPVTGFNTSTVQVKISGMGFVTGADIILMNGNFSIQGTVLSQAGTKILGFFPITDAPLGTYNLTVSNPGNINTTKPGVFTVLAPGIAPIITSLNPVSGFNSAAIPVTVYGMNFRNPVVFINQGMILKIASATRGKISTASVLYVTLPLSGLQGGLYNITIQNSDGVNTTAQNIFYVTDKAWISSPSQKTKQSGFVSEILSSSIEKKRSLGIISLSNRDVRLEKGDRDEPLHSSQ